jgi:hypothetical protein
MAFVSRSAHPPAAFPSLLARLGGHKSGPRSESSAWFERWLIVRPSFAPRSRVCANAQPQQKVLAWLIFGPSTAEP